MSSWDSEFLSYRLIMFTISNYCLLVWHCGLSFSVPPSSIVMYCVCSINLLSIVCNLMQKTKKIRSEIFSCVWWLLRRHFKQYCLFFPLFCRTFHNLNSFSFTLGNIFSILLIYLSRALNELVLNILGENFFKFFSSLKFIKIYF